MRFCGHAVPWALGVAGSKRHDALSTGTSKLSGSAVVAAGPDRTWPQNLPGSNTPKSGLGVVRGRERLLVDVFRGVGAVIGNSALTVGMVHGIFPWGGTAQESRRGVATAPGRLPAALPPE